MRKRQLVVLAAHQATLCHGFASSAGRSPLLLTPLIDAGMTSEAREASQVMVDGEFKGHAGYLSVASASGERTNHLWFWFQPCHKGCKHGEVRHELLRTYDLPSAYCTCNLVMCEVQLRATRASPAARRFDLGVLYICNPGHA